MVISSREDHHLPEAAGHSSFGSPAVKHQQAWPVTLRPCLTAGLPLSRRSLPLPTNEVQPICHALMWRATVC